MILLPVFKLYPVDRYRDYWTGNLELCDQRVGWLRKARRSQDITRLSFPQVKNGQRNIKDERHWH